MANTRNDIARLGKGRGWYQYIEILEGVTTKSAYHEKSIRRTQPFVKWVEQYVQPEDTVLDIGCNAGLYSLVAGQICRRVYGVEVVQHYTRQAEWVKQQWETRYGVDLSHVTFHTLNINKRLELMPRFTFLIASKVLYHKDFKAGIHSFMRHVRKSPIKTILAQGHTTRGRLGGIQGMLWLFKSYGFSAKLLENVREYPIVIATRK